MTDTIIDVKDLTFSYHGEQENPTVNQLTFHVKRGEWLSIVGHNGSGKSTTVRLIDGLLEADSGQIYVDGQLLTEDNVWQIRHKIAMVFQNPDNQFVGATVEDDVAFGLENKGLPLAEMIKRVDEALDLVGMLDFKTREPARLSGGQKQRVVIAGAIAMQPEIIILDEATSMLDPEGRLELIKTMQKIRDQYGLTVISITHDLDEVALSDRVLVLKNGSLESSSSPKQLFSRQDDLLELGLDRPFTADLIQTLQERAGFTFADTYLTEEDLEEELWASISKA